MVIKKRSPHMRHITRTHRINLDWLWERINVDIGLNIRYLRTSKQVADILTKGQFTGAQFESLLRIIQLLPENCQEKDLEPAPLLVKKKNKNNNKNNKKAMGANESFTAMRIFDSFVPMCNNVILKSSKDDLSNSLSSVDASAFLCIGSSICHGSSSCDKIGHLGSAFAAFDFSIAPTPPSNE